MAIELKAHQYFNGDGTQKTFAFSFDYVSSKYIKVALNGIILTYDTDYSVSAGTVTFTEPPVGEVHIYRETPTTQLVNWVDASVLREYDMNKVDTQMLHILEENQDYINSTQMELVTSKITVDDKLSETSRNPVQNRVLTAILRGEVDVHGGGGGVLSFDTVEKLKTNGTLNLEKGKEFKLLGYYKANDGGGANYVCRYISSTSTYPWAIDLGATNEIEYRIAYNLDGTPVIDPDTGDYVLMLDDNDDPIPVYDVDGITFKYKHLYAVITDTVVNYRMFGAVMDGETDDYTAIYNAHKYQHDNYTIEPISGRKHYYIKIENHNGIIRKDNADPIICSGNIDLSGSQLLIQDVNATWFGFYLWGDNEEDYLAYEPLYDARKTLVKDNFVINVEGNEGEVKPNSLIFLRENPYAVRDDGGYIYSEPRYELLLHTQDGVLTSPLTEDWDETEGLEIAATVSDYNTHEVRTETYMSHFESSYNRLPATHYYFKGCEVKLATTANKYCSVLWCKCHNAHISGFTFYPDSAQMHNTVFKNTMIYLWGCYNTEVSHIVGFNAAGKKEGSSNGTSGYVIRATNCLQLNLHDISVQGYWGATAMNCVKDVHITRVNINRLDIHNYFYNLYVDQCNLFNHAIQIGEGRGICQITNSNFYINPLPGDSYSNAHILEFNLTYGRIFEGKVLIQNCNAFVKGADGNEFDVCKIDFSPEAVSTLNHYKFPEVTIRDCHFYSYDANTYLVYFMVAGTRRCTTSTKAPAVIKDYCRDTGNDDTGTLVWRYIGRGVDWIDNGDTSRLTVIPGQIVRTYSSFIDSEGKTSFYDRHYFVVTTGGVLPVPTTSNAPTNYTGAVFTLGTAQLKYVDSYRWEASRQYNAGDICFTENNNWLPVYCYECVTAGTSNGYRPTHLTGTAIEGEDVYPATLDACWWEHTSTFNNFVTTYFTAGMTVTAGEILYADHRLYRVINGGKLLNTPPLNTAWNGSFTEGTATLGFIGKEWSPITWWSQGSYCISTGNDGVKHVYKLVEHDGTTSGSIPAPSSGRLIDGDVIWQYTTASANKVWAAQTQFYTGDIVSHNDNNYECIFDGRLELPRQIIIENISSNMVNGDIFAFWESGTDIPTKLGSSGKWTIKVTNTDVYRFRDFDYYFCHEGNPAPTIIEDGATSSGTTVTIANGSITQDKLSSDVQNKLLGTKNVTAANIADSTITEDKLAFTISTGDGTSGGLTSVSWSDIKDVPTEFPPAEHTHEATAIKGLATVATSGSYDDLTATPTVDTVLSEISENAVQNMAIKKAINAVNKRVDSLAEGGSGAGVSSETTYILKDNITSTSDTEQKRENWNNNWISPAGATVLAITIYGKTISTSGRVELSMSNESVVVNSGSAEGNSAVIEKTVYCAIEPTTLYALNYRMAARVTTDLDDYDAYITLRCSDEINEETPTVTLTART